MADLADVVERVAARAVESGGRSWRRGFYRALTSASKSLRRSQINPGWMESGSALDNALRISSGILDVEEKAGTPVAIISEDGLPERPAILGALWDETHTPSSKSAWLRALLESAPGLLELGALSGLRLKVGTNTGDLSGVVADKIVIGIGSLEIRLSLSGKVGIGTPAAEAVGSLAELASALNDLTAQIIASVGAIETAAAVPTPLTTATLATLINAAGLGLISATITTDILPKIAAAATALDALKE